MYIALDVMGGDNAPHAPVKGAIRAVKNSRFDLKIILKMQKTEVSIRYQLQPQLNYLIN